MIYNKLGTTNLEVSAVCLGTWVFGGEGWGEANDRESLDVVAAALDQGINFIDTAPIYGNGRSESIVGKALKGRRETVIIATKCGLFEKNKKVMSDLSPQSILREIEYSLRRLDTEYIDLYQCHWPDEKVPLEQTIETLMQLRTQGKIRHIGLSNYSAPDLEKALALTDIVTMQVQYSLLDRSIEEQLLPACKKNRVGILAYGPLAGGILSGKYKTMPAIPADDARSYFYKWYQGSAFKIASKLVDHLNQLDHPLSQTAINWVRQQEGVLSVLAGCRTVRQVKDNAAASTWELSKQEMAAIQKILSTQPTTASQT